MPVSVSVFLLMSVRDCVDQCPCSCMVMSVSVSESMFVTEFVFVTVSVTLSVSVVVPVTSSVRVCVRGRGSDHIFERVTVRVAACTFSVIVSMHDHVSVRVSVECAFPCS